MAEGSGSSLSMVVLGIAGLVVVGGIAVWSGQQRVDLHEEGPEPTEVTSPKVPGVGSTPEPDWFREQREAAEAALAANPEDLTALNTLTQLYLGDPPMAMKYNKKALELAPDDADARVLKAALASEMAMPDRAIELLDEVLADEPENKRALYFRGIVPLTAGDAEAAIPHLERAIEKIGPDPGLKAALGQARQQVDGGGDLVVSGTLQLDSEVPGAAVFVSVRDPAGGPPLAALQLPNGPWPLEFSVTTADAISMGGAPRPFPEVVDVHARLDQDGNATTKVEGEPAAVVSGVALGAEGVAVTLAAP